MDGSTIFLFAAILIIGGLLFAFMSLSKTGMRHLDVSKYQARWLALEQQLKQGEVTSYHMTVLSADKLLDLALKERGFKGVVMADRLKNAVQLFSNRNDIWSAHKLRNRIAHETDVAVTYADARQALSSFKQALKDVGAI